VFAAVLGCALMAPGSASAYSHRHSRHRHHARAASRGTRPAMYHAALLEDADTGKILFDRNSEMQWPPASMAKMTLLLVAYKKIKAGEFTLDSPVRISERAAHTEGSRLGLIEGQVYPLGELMKAALIKSANDAAVAVAEKTAGSVEAAVRMMNRQARQLGMTNTEYHTVDGLPPRPGHDVDHTDARDLATVARALIHQTNLLRWSSREETPFDGGVCMLHNTNHLIGRFYGCDGLKTGFTFQAGFNVTATARRGNMRLIAVILGAPSNRQRFAQAAKLLNWGFDNFTSVAVLRRGQTIPVRVQVASGPTISPVVAHSVKVVVPRMEADSIDVTYRVPRAVSGPVRPGDKLGQVLVQDRGETLAEVNVLSSVTVEQAKDGFTGESPATYHQEGQ
jgi:D-alanyl-D-alanine carboxypeptidase (penicillin-binding protein 5/6)